MTETVYEITDVPAPSKKFRITKKKVAIAAAATAAVVGAALVFAKLNLADNSEDSVDTDTNPSETTI